MKVGILILTSEEHQRRVMTEFLASQGFDVMSSSSPQDASELLRVYANRIKIVIADADAFENSDATSFIRMTNGSTGGKMDFILVVESSNTAAGVKALKAGASDYVVKPLELDGLANDLNHLVRIQKLQDKVSQLEKENTSLRTFRDPIADAPSMKELQKKVDRVNVAEGPVLLAGERGVGKETWAREIHQKSTRAAGPIITVNCSSVPEPFLDRTFFGQEKGDVGILEKANRGTVFLKEVGKLPLEFQHRLAYALQTKRLRRVGARFDTPFDVRVIASSSTSLEDAVEVGRFSQEFYDFVSQAVLRIPALRERFEDLPALTKELAAIHAEALGIANVEMEDSFINALRIHRYPGNVRELSNLIERALLFHKEDKLSQSDVPKDLVQVPLDSIEAGQNLDIEILPETDGSKTLGQMMGDHEKKLLAKALQSHDRDIDKICRLLRVSRSTLYAKISKHGLLR